MLNDNRLTVTNCVDRNGIIASKPTVQRSGQILCILMKAVVPLVEDDTTNTTQSQQQSSLRGFLQGKLFFTGEERDCEVIEGRKEVKPCFCELSHLSHFNAGQKQTFLKRKMVSVVQHKKAL